ncbi:MAG: hypothetical protein QM764_11115 [Chitinophagaceae bacterium]
MYQRIRTTGVFFCLCLSFLFQHNSLKASEKIFFKENFLFNSRKDTILEPMDSKKTSLFSTMKGGIMHTEKLSDGESKVIVEKNIIVLLAKTSESFSKRKNKRIARRNYVRLSLIKSELNKFFNSQSNELEDGTNVFFNFNVIGLAVSKQCNYSSDSIYNIGCKYGILSSDTLFHPRIHKLSPAAVISTAAPKGCNGETNGIGVRFNPFYKGSLAHEIGHTFDLEDNSESAGIMSNKPSTISSREINKILDNCIEQ